MSKEIEKVLFLTIDFPPRGGGMARHAYDAANAIRGVKFTPLVLTPEMEGDKAFDKKAVVNIVRLRGIKMDRLFERYLWSVAVFFVYTFYYCITSRVKVIFVNTWSISGVSAFLANLIFRIPYFVFVHGLDVYAPQRDKRAARLMAMVLKRSKKVIVNSSFTKGLIERILPGIQAVVINPVVDIDRFNAERRIMKEFEGKKVLLTVGRLVESKGHDMVLLALQKVKEVFPEVVYCIVGEGPKQEDLNALVRKLGLGGNVIFAGRVNDEELPSYHHSCDIFIMTSKEIKERGEVEGFGIVFLEAGACGKPVIGGKSGGIPDAVIDGVTGILVDPNNVDEIASAIIRLLSDRDLALRLGENGRKRVERELNITEFGKKLNEVICGKIY